MKREDAVDASAAATQRRADDAELWKRPLAVSKQTVSPGRFDSGELAGKRIGIVSPAPSLGPAQADQRVDADVLRQARADHEAATGWRRPLAMTREDALSTTNTHEVAPGKRIGIPGPAPSIGAAPGTPGSLKYQPNPKPSWEQATPARASHNRSLPASAVKPDPTRFDAAVAFREG